MVMKYETARELYCDFYSPASYGIHKIVYTLFLFDFSSDFFLFVRVFIFVNGLDRKVLDSQMHTHFTNRIRSIQLKTIYLSISIRNRGDQ